MTIGKTYVILCIVNKLLQHQRRLHYEHIKSLWQKERREKMIFSTLADTPSSIRRAKKTAKQHGYEITKAVRVGTSATMFKEQDVTEYFLTT